jgi:NodT family efflux transporter outer membrane factor (OMF) lipoprotein
LLRSTGYAQQVVALTVTADVATTYFRVLGLRQRVAVAIQNLELARRVLTVTERRVLGGLSSRVELAQQQTLVAGQDAQIPALQQAEREALNALAILLGRPPENFLVEATGLAGIAAPPVSPGLPAELLRRRPDIAQAEANLEAAQANVAVARAAFFPSIGLSVAGGLTTGEAFTALGGTGLLFNVGASLLQTIFDGGRLQGQRQFAEAEQLELVSAYRGNILNALYDVESALSLNVRLAEQSAARRRQVESATQAFDFSDRMYQEGLIDLLALLQAQQTLFIVQDELLQIELARLQAAVGLYRALGGGWNQDDPSVIARQ